MLRHIVKRTDIVGEDIHGRAELRFELLPRYSPAARASITLRQVRVGAAIPALFDLLEAEGWDHAIGIPRRAALASPRAPCSSLLSFPTGSDIENPD